MMASLFFESSTRTDMSFQSAMRRIGGDVISVSNGIQFSSMYKGENIADTVRAVACYADVIVIRHEQTGTAAEAAVSVDSLKHKLNRHAVVINAGDGVGYGVRQTHFNLVSPVSLSMPANLLSLLKQRGISYTETEILDGVIRDTDVLYWTRVQEERFRDRTAYEAIKDRFILLPQTIVNAKPDMIIMHPLPRKHEMGTPADHQVLDTDPRTVYFEQMRNGMYVRMALLAKVIQGAYV
ncbi:hypothetical protein CHS0354_018412 [Potamilus streckersoni]|uniref:Aspartate carbamoyltransferase n=1 Tax=Potamilus streckersoni TaxID=2493646 RepID=A0AAE0TBP6_9BIVA|nr:hypothetical protein CHS0354_018412 [Potamilus streckersoni]